MRTKDEQQAISPSARARDIVAVLIARHGLLQAIEVGHCIEAQLAAAVEQQKRLHPEDWVQPLQSLQTEPPKDKKVLVMPQIQAENPHANGE